MTPAIPRSTHTPPIPTRPQTRALVAAAALGLAAWLLPPTATAQVSRCVDRNGNSVFTDRPCEALDSASRVPRGGATRRGSAYRGACARSLPVLIRDLSAAIESRDVNRLGMLYLWAGVSDAQAVLAYNRLQSIVERPLLDIVPLRREVTVAVPASELPATAPPADAAAPARAAAGAAPPRADLAWNPATPGNSTPGNSMPGSAATALPGPTPPPATRTRTVVTGLRLEQTAGRRATPASVVLGLRRAYDCWWISLPVQ